MLLLPWWQWWGQVTTHVFSSSTAAQGGRILIVIGAVQPVTVCYLLIYARCYGDARLSPCGERAVPRLIIILVTFQASHLLILVQGLGVGFTAGRSGEEKTKPS